MLNRDQMTRVRALTSLVSQGTALPQEVEELANLFRKAGVPEDLAVEALLREAGFDSIEAFARSRPSPEADDAAKSVVYAAMGLMLAYVVDKTIAEA